MSTDDALDDDALMRSARSGDEGAFQVLFERHVPALRSRIQRILPDHLTRKLSLADLLQEVRIDAFRGTSDFDRKKGTPAGWLMGIARNKALMAARHYRGTAKRAAQAEISRGVRPDTGQFQGGDPSPSEVAVSAETARRVRQALGVLPTDYREVLRLVFVDGLTLREASVRMDRSREAVKKLYGRALLRCQEAYTELEDGRDG